MPLFWFRIASAGSPPERYTLQFPFQLGPSHSLKLDDIRGIASGQNGLELVENQGIHLLRVTGFKTSKEAEAFLPKIRGALLRLTVVKKLSLRTGSGLQQVRLNNPPIDVRGNPNFGQLLEKNGWTHLDGSVDPSPAVVIPEHLRIMEFGAGSVSFTIGMPAPTFLENLADGLALPQPEQISENERLSLSIDLYAASLWETSQRAQVIGLATSLEALLEPSSADQTALRHLDRLLETFDSERERSTEDEEQQRALDRFRSRLAGLKEESISENLRRLATAHASALGESTQEARRNMNSAYGVRSKLLHDGHAPSQQISAAAAWLSKAVPTILESIIARESKPRKE